MLVIFWEQLLHQLGPNSLPTASLQNAARQFPIGLANAANYLSCCESEVSTLDSQPHRRYRLLFYFSSGKSISTVRGPVIDLEGKCLGR